MLGFIEQVESFNFGSKTNHTTMLIGGTSDLGSSSSTRPYALPNLQIDNSAQMLNGGGASGNLPKGGTSSPQACGDQMINNNEFLAQTCETHNGEIGDLDEFFVDWANVVKSFLFFF
jgi:hypothetical protein